MRGEGVRRLDRICAPLALPPLGSPLKVLNGDALEEEQNSPESDAKLGSSSSSSSAPPDYSAPPGSRFFDVNLDDTVADPLATVTKLYEHFGWTVSDEYKTRRLSRPVRLHTNLSSSP